MKAGKKIRGAFRVQLDVFVHIEVRLSVFAFHHRRWPQKSASLKLSIG